MGFECLLLKSSVLDPEEIKSLCSTSFVEKGTLLELNKHNEEAADREPVIFRGPSPRMQRNMEAVEIVGEN